MDAAMVLLREVTVPYPKSALFKLAAEGHTSVFEILVACIVSIRTFEETTLPVARRLFDNRITTRRTLTTTSAATLASRSAPF